MRTVSYCLALLAATAGLGGCFSDGKGLGIDDLVVDMPKAGATYPIDAVDCRFVLALVPVPAEAVAKYVPETFRPIKPEALGLPDDPRGDAVLAIEANRCAQGAAADGTPLRDVTTGGVWVPANPPENLKEPDVDRYAVTLLHVTWDETVRAHLDAKHVSTDSGQAAFVLPASALAPTGFDMAAFSATLSLGLGGEYAWTAVGATDVDFAPQFQAFTGLAFMPLMHQAFVKAKGDFHAQTIHEAAVDVRVPASSAAFEILGQEEARGYALAGVGSYENAVMTFPTEHGGQPTRDDHAGH